MKEEDNKGFGEIIKVLIGIIVAIVLFYIGLAFTK